MSRISGLVRSNFLKGKYSGLSLNVRMALKELCNTCDIFEKEIERQEAEIERLQKEGLVVNKTFMAFVNKLKAEAIKEFAERLKERHFLADKVDIDNLVKEMTEGIILKEERR